MRRIVNEISRTSCYVGLFLVLYLIFLLASVALADSSSGYDLLRWTVDGGGGQCSGGDYALNGIIGQPDVGYTLAGGGYTLGGGFWGIGMKAQHDIYLPLVVRNDSTR